MVARSCLLYFICKLQFVDWFFKGSSTFRQQTLDNRFFSAFVEYITPWSHPELKSTSNWKTRVNGLSVCSDIFNSRLSYFVCLSVPKQKLQKCCQKLKRNRMLKMKLPKTTKQKHTFEEFQNKNENVWKQSFSVAEWWLSYVSYLVPC